MNYVERHFGDWARDTAHLSMLEEGAYNRLIDLYYVREQALPIDLAACCRLSRAITSQERAAVKSVLAEFFQQTDEGWTHKRCDREIDRFRTKSGKASASAKARWSAHANASSDGDANASTKAVRHARAATSSQAPLPNLQEEIPPPTGVVASAPAGPPRLPPCPVDELIASYHRHLPMLPRVGVVNDGRKKTLAARWREVVTDEDIRKAADPKAAALEWFAWFFDHASKSDFLTGKAKDWRADFDFLLTPSKFAKVVEGAYHRAIA